MDAAVRARQLTKRYAHTVALDSLTLDVPRGAVFGYLGPNGAGKTTTIRLLMGLLGPTRGHVELLGTDPRAADARRVLARVGYLPGEFTAYPDLTADEYLDYLARLRGGVSRRRLEVLLERFGLDPTRRLRELSHGNRQKVGLVQAFMHEPELLVLDEPTAGLDPLMQREFRLLVTEQRSSGRTVFLSSHVLDEVEAVADTVGILRDGRLLIVEKVEDLKARARRRVRVTFRDAPPAEALSHLEGVRDLQREGSTLSASIEGSMEAFFRLATPCGIETVVTHEAGLEEIFMDQYDGAS